jgi:hypothetical protein
MCVEEDVPHGRVVARHISEQIMGENQRALKSAQGDNWVAVNKEHLVCVGAQQGESLMRSVFP